MSGVGDGHCAIRVEAGAATGDEAAAGVADKPFIPKTAVGALLRGQLSYTEAVTWKAIVT